MSKSLSKKTVTFIKKYSKKKISLSMLFTILVIIAIITLFVIPTLTEKEYDPQITVTSTIEKIINKSELSTFQVTYNGVATVKNSENSEKVAYYVSYNAITKAGFDFSKLNPIVDEVNKKIIVEIPEITLQKPNVDISSLQYIFIDKSKDKLGVSQEAYKECINDVVNESEKDNAIKEIAKNNAKNIVIGLLEPFVEEMDGNYELEVR